MSPIDSAGLMPLLFLYLRTLFLSLRRTLYLTLSPFLSFHLPFSPSIPLTLSFTLSVSLLSLSRYLSLYLSLYLTLPMSLSLSLFTYLRLSLYLFPIFSIFRLGRAVIRLGRWGGITRVEWAENKSSHRERSYEQTALWYWKRDPAFAIQFNR